MRGSGADAGADAGRLGARKPAPGESSTRAFFLGLVATAAGAADACAEAVAAAAAAGAAIIKEPDLNEQTHVR